MYLSYNLNIRGKWPGFHQPRIAIGKEDDFSRKSHTHRPDLLEMQVWLGLVESSLGVRGRDQFDFMGELLWRDQILAIQQMLTSAALLVSATRAEEVLQQSESYRGRIGSSAISLVGISFFRFALLSLNPRSFLLVHGYFLTGGWDESVSASFSFLSVLSDR